MEKNGENKIGGLVVWCYEQDNKLHCVRTKCDLLSQLVGILIHDSAAHGSCLFSGHDVVCEIDCFAKFCGKTSQA